jgi:hypothetical protein
MNYQFANGRASLRGLQAILAQVIGAEFLGHLTQWRAFRSRDIAKLALIMESRT